MKKSVLMGALLICIAPSVFGQKKSAYEIKKIAIENKYLQQMGVPLSDITQLRKKGDLFINALFAEKLSLYGKRKGTAQQMALVSRMADELKAAEKLKTAAEIKAEKDKVEKSKQRWEEYEKREKERKQEEREQKIQFYYKKQSDVNKTKLYVKKEFLKWAKKGEFESTNEYQERIQKEGKQKLIEFVSTAFVNDYNSRTIRYKLGTYDADKEIYPISLINKVTIYVYRTEKEYEELLDAKINKDYYSDGRYEFYTDVEVSITDDIKMNKENAIALKGNYDLYRNPNNIDEWIIKDGYFLPISFEFNGNKYLFDKGDYPLLSSLQISTTELGLSEYFPENYTFTLDKDIFKEEMK